MARRLLDQRVLRRTPMTLARAGCALVLACCTAANATAVLPAAPAAPPASDPAGGGFAPSAASAALDAVRRNAAREAPACRVDRTDAIVAGRIHVRVGETLCVTLRVDGDHALPAGLVAADASADVLVVAARQEGGRTFLTLTNPLPRWVRYRAWMHRPGAPGFGYTSSCPVMSDHRVGFEDWPYAIDEFALGDFTLEPAGTEGGPRRQVECR